MKIQIDDNWSVESDASSWNLHFEKIGDINPNTEKPIITRDVSYHVRLKDALKFYLNETMKDATDVKSLIARIELAEANIDKLQVN